ncbi:MAG: hypothetical protein IPJ88_11795 [Myxococcales bacterium]|nr:MAG: hypothetical protein IPJ88_11795 [Myxococcales bacterium]
MLETSLIVAVVGSVLAIGIPTFFKNFRSDKTDEAVQILEQIHNHAASYFEQVHNHGRLQQCLPEKAGPTPKRPSAKRKWLRIAKLKKKARANWKILGIKNDQKLRYRYSFLPTKSGCNLSFPPRTPVFIVRAEGDLDGDGNYSLYERKAQMNRKGKLVPFGPLIVRDPLE